MRTTRWITALTALLLALFTFGTALLSSNSGHEWGDDFAGYLTEAIAIANGTCFTAAGFHGSRPFF